MKPSEQINLVNFLKEVLPPEYYVVANDDYVEVHKKDIAIQDGRPSLQATLFDEKGY